MDARLDWEATIAYRRHLWGLGLGVAEAMDTAQRGMGLDWATSLELIEKSAAEARAIPGAIVFCGAGTDHLPSGTHSLEAVIHAYEEQISAIEAAGGRLILMASRALAAAARGPIDYSLVYERVLAQLREKAIIHWLGDMFDPALAGYWGSRDLDIAGETALEIITHNAGKIDGVKISLLDKGREIALRRRLPSGVRMYTGDDFNYPELIAGGSGFHSDALLGIFDAIAPAASAALLALDRGNVDEFHGIFAPTVPLSRHIFRAPTRYYKTGVTFMAYLNGHQQHFTMVGGQESARSLLHLTELFRLADEAGLIVDPDVAAARMKVILHTHGVES
jgi:dihydrodipicolinate synthase/N-acetylneuraminate lyase